MSASPLRVLIVENHRMFAQALEMFLSTADNIEVIRSVGSGEEALRVCEETPPDMALIDIDLPGMNGLDVIEQMLKRCPDCRVVVVTGVQDAEIIAAATSRGARGYVSKTRAADELLEVIAQVADGEVAFPSESLQALVSTLGQSYRARGDGERLLDQLTTRELEILQIISDGYSTRRIAEELFISPFTVQSHVKSILAKLGAHSKLEAVAFARRHGVIRDGADGEAASRTSRSGEPTHLA